MTEQAAQEPTMEEILASIRRIISEDDAPAETAPVAEAAPEPAPEPEAVVAAPEPAPIEDEVLELTEPYEAPATEAIGDLDVADAAPFPTESTPAAPQPAAVAAEAETLVGETAAASAASAFAGLAASFQKPEPAVASAADMNFMSGNTVEAMVREMLRPMLKDWLDANLPTIVEAQVRKEVERIARNAG
nr:DUF2497 domain-containing protein [Brevundimonas diminuta]